MDFRISDQSCNLPATDSLLVKSPIQKEKVNKILKLSHVNIKNSYQVARKLLSYLTDLKNLLSFIFEPKYHDEVAHVFDCIE